MTRKVITITSGTTITEAAKLMLLNHISGLPVVDDAGKVIGIISQGDFIRRSEIGTQRKHGRWLKYLMSTSKAASDYVHEHGRKVGEIMTTEVLTIAEDTSLEEVVNLMERGHIKRLPVLRDGLIVGIVTRTNILQAVASLAREVPDPTANDDHIRDRIIAAIDKADWRPFGLGVVVFKGVVQLNGIISNEESRQAAIVAAENIAGVTKVHDHLCWVETMSGMYIGSPEDEALQKAS
jgi:CBS domain-containing protein